jgi:succinate dehydrogenase / fumarate reductase, cytochrome b subunit
MSTLAVAPPEAGTKPRLTTVSAKFLVALTGLGLVGFVIGHMTGNLLLFKGRDALNNYAKFLEESGALLWTARIGLLIIFVLHIILTIGLQRRNKAARPVKYYHHKHLTSTPASRTMLLTGLVLLAFVLFHLAHYTFGVVQQVPQLEYSSGKAAVVPTVTNPTPRMIHPWDLKDQQGRRDVYAMTVYGFRNPWITLLYVIAMGFLVFHLYHGGSSMFQSLGINHPRYNPVIHRVGKVIAVVVGIGNMGMPLAVLFGLVGGDVPRV